jgi:hypothetical protein
MWELIANGINIAGNLASAGSFISSFSVDRDTKAIKTAVVNIERQLTEFNSLFKDINKPDYLETYLSPFLDLQSKHAVKSDDILGILKGSQEYHKRSHQGLINSHHSLITSLSELILEIAYTSERPLY